VVAVVCTIIAAALVIADWMLKVLWGERARCPHAWPEPASSALSPPNCVGSILSPRGWLSNAWTH